MHARGSAPAQEARFEYVADFVCRTPPEIRLRMREIAEADAIGDPSLLPKG